MTSFLRKSIGEQSILSEVFSRCHVILLKLMDHRHGWLFSEPVDVKGLRADGYYDVVNKPMDLGTVKCRLEKGRYSNPLEFAEDVQQTFHNAIKYNEQGDDVYIMAAELLQIFTLEWSKVKVDFAPLFNNTERFENPSMGATSRSKKGKGKVKEKGRARDLRVSDEKFSSWRKIFSDESLPAIEDEEDIQDDDHPAIDETSAKLDEVDVHQLKGMLAETQEKLRESKEKLTAVESENESLRITNERLQQESNSALNEFWDGFYKAMSDPTWP